MNTEFVTKEPIAIIGLGCVLPDAPDVATFWNNLLAGKSSIREVPRDRWDPDLYYSTDRSLPNKTYAKIGAFVTDNAFSPLEYKVLPTAVAQIDPSQLWALASTRQALKDAGLKTGLKADEAHDAQAREFDRNKCAVILGNAMGGEQMKLQTKNIYWNQVEAILRSDPSVQKLSSQDREALMDRARAEYQRGVPIINEDSMPGTLSNVAAGRIANVFDLAGKNFTTDAACASSIAALDSAVDSLRKGESDLVIWGGTDRSMDVTPYVEFSKIGALSPDGSRPFDKDANGFVMGEGCALFVLKRLADAERDGDKIYALIRGVGGSSDGKGKGITAPNPAGQVKAVLRAYEDAGIDPYTVTYIEAHGTSTPVGDPVELQSAQEAFKQLNPKAPPPGTIAVGSVKSNLGHLKSAAGAAGVLKVCLALKNGILPPSINVKTLNPKLDWATSPFRVQTEKSEWPRPANFPRRAAVSSFGFGGTNFHVVLEEYIPGRLQRQAPPQSSSMIDLNAFTSHMSVAQALEAEPVVLDGTQAPMLAAKIAATSVTFSKTGKGPRLRDVLAPVTAKGLAAPSRVGFVLSEPAEIVKKLEQAQKALGNPAAMRLAFNQGVFMNQGKPAGKVAFLFPGQGTQYVNMMRDLAQKYEVVRNTFLEADQILLDELDGVKLTDILWPTPDTPENQAASEKKLQLTEFTQPAVLAADVAILRLLRQWGVEPDVVAGHSLGEYGALVAAGVLSFADALHAVAARGREMAHVEVPDLGKMASVSADWTAVEDAIKGVKEYVIPANKNCPSQTVIAGSTKGVDEAVKLLQAKGLQAQYLPVSAAFHSAIVAPASKPLRNVLSRLDVKSPKVRVLSNVGTKPYEADPEWIRDNLATQVASPVEWIGIIERMYEEGVRTFIEVGPKLALTNFVRDILKEKSDAVAIGSNHPKKGGLTHVNELYAFLGAWGFNPRVVDAQDAAVYTKEYRDPTAAFTRGSNTAVEALAQQVASLQAAVEAIQRGTISSSGKPTAAPGSSAHAAAVHANPSAAPSPSAAAAVSPSAASDRAAAFGFNLDDIGVSGISVGLPGRGHPLFDEGNWERILKGENLIDNLDSTERAKIVDKNIVRLQKGGDGSAQFQVISDIAQVIQLAGQRGGFDVADYGVNKELADSLDRTFQYAIAAGLEALRDAGIPLQRTYLQTSQGGYLPKEWKLPEPMRDETGIIFASAFPGYDNLLRDVSRYLADKFSGKTRDELQRLYDELVSQVQDAELKGQLQDAFDAEFQRLAGTLTESATARYEFNRKFLFNVLSMGHSQLAQFIGARGPNTQVNAACASTTQALALAEDWIRTGRCKRVLVVGADDVTSDAMFEWIGAGFLASGAATTKKDVAEAALPFDKRRHGMIVGMGAVGLVMETVPECQKRGMRPIAKLLATRISNSAFHGSRLDVSHIATEMQALLASASRKYGITPDGIAAQTVFMSHETYTPARGGSASAEIAALRAAFGAKANQVVVANTKGFTGHPQGAGIEDAIVLKCMQRGRLPPIANFKEPDPELGDLNLSKGGEYPQVRYALRLAAGFGSQVAMSLTELVAKENERVADAARYQAWLSEVSGLPAAKTEVANRTLRIVDQGAPARKPLAASVATPAPVTASGSAPQSTAAAPAAPPPAAASSASPTPKSGVPAASEAEVLAKLVALVAEKTGYPTDLLDPKLDMEADLGIDTVKQAEVFGIMRDTYGLPQDQSVQIKDYNTLEKVAKYMHSRLGSGGASASASSPSSPASPAPVQASAPAPVTAPTTPPPATTAAPAGANPTPAPASKPAATAPSGAGVSTEAVLAKLIAIVSEKTGYPTDLLDPNLDMEADLGIDTVKQAEVFGTIRDAYQLPQEEGLQIKDYPTLNKVAGYIASRASQGGSASSAPTTMPAPGLQDEAPRAPASSTAAPSAPAQPSPAQTSPAQSSPAATPPARTTPSAQTGATSASLDPAAVLKQVIELVAAKTGYPADMLEPDLDMEADLGIDTVKQAELFGEVRATYGIPMLEGLLIKDYPTLRKVAGFVLANAGAPAASGPVTKATTAAPSTSTILRRVPNVRPQPLPKSANALPTGTVLMLGDPDTHLTEALTGAGWKVVHQIQEGTVGLVVVASRQGPTAMDRLGPAFDAAKALRGSLKFALILTRQDGSHGLHHVRDAGMAALAGFGKALRKELQAVVKVVDIHPECPDAAGKALSELQNGGTRTEVSYGRDGARFVMEVAPQALPMEGPDVEGKSIVVSGGAQGITVELLAALAEQKPKLLLLGRTELPVESEAWAKLDEAAWKAMEAQVMADMKARGDKVTPVAIQKAMSPRRKAAEVHRNIQRLQDLGATVIYAPVDVQDARGVAEAVAFARQEFGRIHGVIHAAGVEISKDLASKDRAQFEMVFDIKAKGWDALMSATRDDKLEFLVAFGSIAGRFGNIGQTDYSAANEYLAKAVKQEAGRRKCMVGTTIAWGPWGEVGMATKGSILQIMETSGVTPIPTQEGVAQFLAELAQPGIRESVVAGNVGAIDVDGQVVAKGFDLATEIANRVVSERKARYPLLEGIDSITPDQNVVASLIVQQARDPAMADHRVDGVPFLPGVFGLEAFAEASSLIVPKDQHMLGAEEIRFALPLKQLKDKPQHALVHAKILKSGAETRVQCRLTSQFHGPDGKPVGDPKLHFEAVLRFGTLATMPKATAPVCDKSVARSGIYPPFFHGPSFQVLNHAGPMKPETVAIYREPTEPMFGQGPAEFHAYPMLLEAIFQTCGLGTLLGERVMSLPAGIRKLDILHTGRLPSDVRVRAKPTGRDAQNNRLFDAEAVSGDGLLLMRVSGYAMVETGAAPDAAPTTSAATGPGTSSHVPSQSSGAPTTTGTNGTSHASNGQTKPAVSVAEPDLVLPQFGSVYLAAARVEDKPCDPDTFTRDEIHKHASFKVPKRAQEWRAGRLAAKKAAMDTHPGYKATDIEVRGDPDGVPQLFLEGKKSPLHLSLTHRDGLAVAALCPQSVGVDLETLEDRPQSFLEEAFAIPELKSLLAAEDARMDVACLWSAKEAALKRAGVGLKSDLRAHVVTPDNQGGAVVEGPATGRLGIRFYEVDGKVLAVSAAELDPVTV